MVRFANATVVLLVTGILLDGARPAGAQCAPAGIDDGPLEVTKGAIDFDVRFDSSDCTGTGDTTTPADAQRCLDAVDASYDLFTGFGFRTPYLNTLPDFTVWMYNIASGLGVTHPGCIEIDAPSFRCDATDGPVRKTTHHELFHSIQRNYMCDVTDCDSGYIGSTFGKWVAEGTARCLDDRLFNDLDSATFGGSFWDEVNGDSLPSVNDGWLEQSYETCLFWSYLCEQLGSTLTEPQRGVDFMLGFWQTIADNGSTDSVTALRDAIAASGGGLFEDRFHDYAICNYARQFDLSGVPNASRYFYVDEGQNGQAGYGTVPITNAALPSAGAVAGIAAYSIRYFEADFDSTSKRCTAVGFHGTSDQDMGWAVIGIDSANKVRVLSKGQGSDYGRTILVSAVNDVTKMGVVMVGLDTEADVDFAFGEGPVQISIVRPTSAQPAFPGPAAEPGRLLVRVLVPGPAELEPAGIGPRSVLGLEASDFSVSVGSNAADVLTAAYVGGEYWLVCQAPPQAANGTYNVSVRLCSDVLGATSTNSAIYGNDTLNHVLVIDRSGSMADPSGTTKLDAAKIAATLYVDAVSDNDRIGVVRFNGDATNCNDDADIIEGIDFASAANQRNDCKTDIGLLTPSGRTAIGDGMWKGQDQLDLFPGVTERHIMVLLSDGMENEARYWDTAAGCATARSRIEPEDTTVNAIAFGPDSDQTLMQNIGTITDGDFSYVDVTAAPGPGAAVTAGAQMQMLDTSVPAPGTMVNQLADAYLDALQRGRRLERLFFTSGEFGPGSIEVIIPVTEVDTTQATFFFNVNNPAANLVVKLFDPSGNSIGPAQAGIHATATHTVFHLFNKPAVGNWRASLNADKQVDYIAGLLGRQRLGAQLVLKVAQVANGGSNNELDGGRFEKGTPVTLLAILSDAKGPIRGAEVEVVVQKPDGTTNCGVILLRDDGRSHDGPADDGVYGGIFTETSVGSRGGVDNDGQGQYTPGVRGSYNVRAKAEGRTNTFEPFVRYASTSFQVYDSREDRDKDELADSWEKHYGLKFTVPDTSEDPDDDGLKNVEEQKHGTNPLNPDTDGGGESDGSEVALGRCPLDPTDDQLPYPLDVEVVMDMGDEGRHMIQPGRNLLRFPWPKSYQQLRIYRAVGQPANFVLHKTIGPGDGADGSFYDAPVMPGVKYYYQFQGVGTSGAHTRLSRIVMGFSHPESPDFDHDGDVDKADLDFFEACANGPAFPVDDQACLLADFDGDSDTDSKDFAVFQGCISGENMPFDLNCMN